MTNGWMAEFIEALCRTYGWSMEYVLNANAVRLALVYRCYSQGYCESNTATFEEEIVMAEKVKEWQRKSSTE